LPSNDGYYYYGSHGNDGYSDNHNNDHTDNDNHPSANNLTHDDNCSNSYRSDYDYTYWSFALYFSGWFRFWQLHTNCTLRDSSTRLSPCSTGKYCLGSEWSLSGANDGY
jgi:hypothetical protein